MLPIRLAAAGTTALAIILGYTITLPQSHRVGSASSPTKVPAATQQAQSVLSRAAQQIRWILPDKQLTPGAIRTTNVSEICSHGTRELRNWSREREDHILERYAWQHDNGESKALQQSKSSTHGRAFQIDHLIPLGIGGADDDNNLWPQPYPDAEAKDKLEWRMRDLVCKHNYDVRALQNEIKEDWVQAYRKYVGGLLP